MDNDGSSGGYTDAGSNMVHTMWPVFIAVPLCTPTGWADITACVTFCLCSVWQPGGALIGQACRELMLPEGEISDS